jgi:hypothetical protein
MLHALPGWVVDNATSVAREAEPYVALSPDERAELVVKLCRIAVSIASGRTDAARVFAYRDPLPVSTELALERLRTLPRHR